MQRECISFIAKIINSFVKSSVCQIEPALSFELQKASALSRKQTVQPAKEEVSEESTEPESSAVVTLTSILRTPSKKEKKEEDIVKEKPIDASELVKELFKKVSSKIIFPVGISSVGIEEGGKLEEKLKHKDSEISTECAEYIVEIIGKAELHMGVLDIISDVFCKDEIEGCDAKIVKSAMQLLVNCVFADPKIYSAKIIKYQQSNLPPGTKQQSVLNFDQMVILGLFSAKSPPIREEFSESLFILSEVLANLSSSKKVAENAYTPFDINFT